MPINPIKKSLSEGCTDNKYRLFRHIYINCKTIKIIIDLILKTK